MLDGRPVMARWESRPERRWRVTKRGRVLVIEDDTEGGESLCALLHVWGYRVFLAKTGQRGIELAIREAPEYVIVDLGLEDMDGCTVVREIRSVSRAPFVIVYSGHHRRESAARAAGCDAFILKPSIDDLELLLNRRLTAKPAGTDSKRRKGPTAA